MPHYYLGTYTGRGSAADPFVPRGSNQRGWSAIDIRTDSRRVDSGYVLVAVPVRDDTIGDYLGDALDATNLAAKSLVELRLGLLNLPNSLRQIIIDLLMQYGRTDGTRWKPLQATRSGLGAFEIHLGERLYRQPVLAGGATVSDNFNRADADPLGDPWVEVTGDWDIVSNEARATVLGDNDARYGTALDSADHRAFCTWTGGASSTTHTGACVRFAAAAETFYGAGVGSSTSVGGRLMKMVAGSATTLATWDADAVSGTTKIECEANGSTVRALQDDVQKASVTDTDITSNTRAGIWSARNGRVDNWQANDLAAAAATSPGWITSRGGWW